MSVALLAQREPAFQIATSIEPDDFASAATAFAVGQRTIESILSRLGGALTGEGSTIGKDRTADYFWQRYLPAADTIMDGLRLLHELSGSIAQGLADSATDHVRADKITTSDWRANYSPYTVSTIDTPPNPPDEADLSGCESPSTPGLDDVWAKVDRGKLQSLISAWTDARDSLRELKSTLSGKIESVVQNSTGEDVNALETFWATYTSGEYSIGNQAIFSCMDDAMSVIVSALNRYGDLANQYSGRFTDALGQVIHSHTPPPGDDGAGWEILFDILVNSDEINQEAHDAVAAVNEQMLGDLEASSEIQDLDDTCGAALRRSFQATPAPATAQQEARQAGDDADPRYRFPLDPNDVDPTGRNGPDPDEIAIANVLKADGHTVMHVPRGKVGRTCDSLVDGSPVEFKTIGPGAGPDTVGTSLFRGEKRGGQAAEFVLDARNSGLSKEQVDDQLRKFFEVPGRPHTVGVIQRVTVLCPGGVKTTWPPQYEGL